jgi:hypothetical protein
MSRIEQGRLAAVGAVVLGAALAAGGMAESGSEAPDRHQAVAAKGAKGMAFGLDTTVHRFAPTDTGGVQELVARDPRDDSQAGDVGAHLRQEADRWKQGDFSAPAAIHGDDMPGLAQLEVAREDLDVVYTELADGGRVTSASDQEPTGDALHAWFDPQVGDHGDHATS